VTERRNAEDDDGTTGNSDAVLHNGVLEALRSSASCERRVRVTTRTAKTARKPSVSLRPAVVADPVTTLRTMPMTTPPATVSGRLTNPPIRAAAYADTMMNVSCHGL